jgi:hypothetical protein
MRAHPKETPVESLPDCDGAGVTDRAAILAGADTMKMGLTSDRPMASADVADLQTGKAILYVYGYAKYTDPYGTDGRTDFCFTWLAGTNNFDWCAGPRNAVR